MEQQKILVQFLSTTPVYIDLVSALEMIHKVSICLLENQSAMVPLKRREVDVTESLSVISLAWSASQYVWRNFDY